MGWLAFVPAVNIFGHSVSEVCVPCNPKKQIAQNLNAEITKIAPLSALREVAENLIAFGLTIPA
jgi:hypothetical protein